MVEGKQIKNDPYIWELDKKEIQIIHLLIGVTPNISFLNIHGAPHRAKNLEKHIHYGYLTTKSDVTVLLETGCVNSQPDVYDLTSRVIRNNEVQLLPFLSYLINYNVKQSFF